LVASFACISPAPAQADDYWDGYWGWYDNTYRPYYYRQYTSPRVGGYMYGPGTYYGSGAYYSPGYYSPGYSYGYGAPAGAYYGTRNLGYRDFGPYGGTVRVGPVRFGWR
jgi:hypothetical protein